MSEKKIFHPYNPPYDGPHSEDMASIVEGRHFGKMQREHVAGDLIEAGNREDEAIVGEAAKEFAEEAALHPERYQYIADHIKRIAEHYKLEHPLIMDFGSGPGILTGLIAERIPSARVIGVDLSDDMLNMAERNIKAQHLESRVQLVHHNVKEVYGDAGELADIVVSRNMLHRLTSLQEGLLALARAAKEKGGIVFNTSFRNLSDLDKAGQTQWIKDFRERNNYPALQEAWVLAYLNAPTLKQYEDATRKVAEIINADEMSVNPGRLNEVNIFLRKRLR